MHRARDARGESYAPEIALAPSDPLQRGRRIPSRFIFACIVSLQMAALLDQPAEPLAVFLEPDEQPGMNG